MDRPNPTESEIAVPIPKGSITDAEWATRIELAAAFRLASHFGWNNTIFNHISVRVPAAPDQMLMNPQGVGWHEVTASCLIKSDFEGNDLSESPLGLSQAGRNFHSTILRLRPDLDCVFHIHPAAGVIISAMKEPLLPIDQSSAVLYGKVSMHEYEGIANEADEGPRIVADLGENRLMIMKNHGLLTVGRTIAEAFAGMRLLVDACDRQVRLFATGREISVIPEEVCRRVQEQVARWTKAAESDGALKWPELEWQMYRRLADQLDPGYRN